MAEPSETALAATAARIERLVLDGDVAEALRLLRETLVAEVGDPHPESVSLNGGLAWLFDRLSDASPGRAYRQKAIGYAQSALLLDPEDALAYAVLPEHETHLVAHNLLRHRNGARARRILERLSPASKSAAQLLALMEFVAMETQRVADLPRRDPSKPAPLLVNANVWGESYVDALFAYGFPSLLADGNLPAVSADRDIIVDFYTSAGDRARIEAHPLTERVRRLAELRYNILPDGLLAADGHDAARWCAGAAQQCSALRAQRVGADLLFLCGSAVYCAGSLRTAYGYLEAGYGAVICMVPRTLEARTHDALGRYADIEDGVIAAGPQALSEFIVGNLHGHSLDCFLTDEARHVAQNPVALFFRTEDGFACRTYEPSPLIISHKLLKSEFCVDYFTIDVRFLSELLGTADYGQAVKPALSPSDGVVVTDVDCYGGPQMRRYGDISLSAATSASGALHTATRVSDIAYFRWALSQRFSFVARNSGGSLPPAEVDEADVMDDLDATIAGGVDAAKRRIAVYERLR